MSFFGNVYENKEMSHRAKAVYMYLKDRSDAEGKCWPGVRTIASGLNLSRATVQRALSELEKGGYIERTPRFRSNGGNTSNLYTII